MKATSHRRRPAESSRYSRQTTMNKVLARWNSLDPAAAAREVLPCCGSQAWATALASKRPITDEAALVEASSTVWLTLPEEAWQEAFDSHPRIGQRACASSRNGRIVAVVGTGAAHRALPGRRSQTRARRGKPALRTEVRTHLHRLRDWKDLRLKFSASSKQE